MGKVVMVTHDPDCSKLHTCVFLDGELFDVVTGLEVTAHNRLSSTVSELLKTFVDSDADLQLVYVYEKPVQYHGAASDPELIKQLRDQINRFRLRLAAVGAIFDIRLKAVPYTPAECKGQLPKTLYHTNILKVAKATEVAKLDSAISSNPPDRLDVLDCYGLGCVHTGRVTRGGLAPRV